MHLSVQLKSAVFDPLHLIACPLPFWVWLLTVLPYPRHLPMSLKPLILFWLKLSQRSALTAGGKLWYEASFMFFYRFLISGNGELLYAVSEYELNIIIHHQRASENCHQGACTDASLNCSEMLCVLRCVIWGQCGIPLKIKPLLSKGTVILLKIHTC